MYVNFGPALLIIKLSFSQNFQVSYICNFAAIFLKSAKIGNMANSPNFAYILNFENKLILGHLPPPWFVQKKTFSADPIEYILHG